MKKLFQLASLGAVALVMTSTAFAGEQLPDGGTSVPDGGATIGLLAIAVAGIAGFAGFVCRRAK